MVSSQKRGDNGSAGMLSVPSPAGVTIKEALRTSRTQGHKPTDVSFSCL